MIFYGKIIDFYGLFFKFNQYDQLQNIFSHLFLID